MTHLAAASNRQNLSFQIPTMTRRADTEGVQPPLALSIECLTVEIALDITRVLDDVLHQKMKASARVWAVLSAVKDACLGLLRYASL